MYAAAVRRRLLRSVLSLHHSSPMPTSREITYSSAMSFADANRSSSRGGDTLSSPWSAMQRRGAKVLGADVRRYFSVIHSSCSKGFVEEMSYREKVCINYALHPHSTSILCTYSSMPHLFGSIGSFEGRIFQVLEAQHTQHGRGGASIQVELRDVDSGNKINERFRTDEAIERVIVEDKSFSFLYQEGDTIFIMDLTTFEQMQIPKEMLGKAAVYLKDDMTVSLQLYDGKPMSASIPRRVTCTVVEAQTYSKGQTAQPQYKRVLLDNGVTVLVPSYIKTGEKVVVDTTDDKYLTRDKE